MTQYFYCYLSTSKEYNYSAYSLEWFCGLLCWNKVFARRTSVLFFFFSTGLHECLAVNASFANAAMHCFTDACVYTDTHPAINLTPLRFFRICRTAPIADLKCLSRLRQIVEQYKPLQFLNIVKFICLGYFILYKMFFSKSIFKSSLLQTPTRIPPHM